MDEAELLRLWREEIASAPARGEFEADVLRRRPVGPIGMTDDRRRYMAEYMRQRRAKEKLDAGHA